MLFIARIPDPGKTTGKIDKGSVLSGVDFDGIHVESFRCDENSHSHNLT